MMPRKQIICLERFPFSGLNVSQISLDNILKITLIYEMKTVNKCLMQTDTDETPS